MSKPCHNELDTFFADNPEWRPYADLVVVPPSAEEIREEFPDADREVLDRAQGGGRIAVGTLYVRMRREGSDDRFAAMLALQQPPRGETSDSFWAGRKHFSRVYGEEYANKIKGMLAKRGVNLKPGDEYMPELARFRGDPEAVVPFGGARSYMRKLCEKRGWACEGAVNVEHRQPERDPLESAPRLAEDLIRDNARRMVAKDPSLKRLGKRELRQAVIERHGAKR